MTDELKELEEALKWTKGALDTGIVTNPKIAPVILKAAQRYAALKPLLDELVEARGKFDSFAVTYKGDQEYADSWSNWLSTAANSTTKIAEVLKDV